MADAEVPSAVVEAARRLVASNKYAYDTGHNRGADWLTDDKMDCSEFVRTALRQAGIATSLQRSSDFASYYPPVTEPQAGDLVYWKTPGHIAIVEDPKAGTFLGAQNSGLAQANYKVGWWATIGPHTFHRPK